MSNILKKIMNGDDEKREEKTSVPLLRCDKRAPYAMLATPGYTLIPRPVPTFTNILVYASHSDGKMVQRSNQQLPRRTNYNSDRGGAGTSQTPSSHILHAAAASGDLAKWNDLCCAACKGRLDVVEYFANKYPNLAGIQDIDKSYPIHKAFLNPDPKVVLAVLKIFITNNVSFEKADAQGRNILHLAAKASTDNLLGVVKYLLSEQPGIVERLFVGDSNNRTPWDLAESSKNTKIMAHLKNAGYDRSTGKHESL